MDTIQLIENPVQYKYDKMLRKWLDKQNGTKQKIYVKIHTALEEMGMVRAAEDFKAKAFSENQKKQFSNTTI